MVGLDHVQDSVVCGNHGARLEMLYGGTCGQGAGLGSGQWQSCCSPPLVDARLEKDLNLGWVPPSTILRSWIY